jgi:hypothetical protein
MLAGVCVFALPAAQNTNVSTLKQECDTGKQDACRQIDSIASSPKSRENDRIAAISSVNDPVLLRTIAAAPSKKANVSAAARLRLKELEAINWKHANDADTADSYKRFLESFPNAALSTEARERIAWLRAVDLDSEDGYRLYLNANPNSHRAYAARLVLDRFLWQRTIAQGTYEAYENYLGSRLTIAYVEEARRRQSETLSDALVMTEDQIKAIRSRIEMLSAPVTILDLYQACNRSSTLGENSMRSSFGSGDSFTTEVNVDGKQVRYMAGPRQGTTGSVMAAALFGSRVEVYHSPGRIAASSLASGIPKGSLTTVVELRKVRTNTELQALGRSDLNVGIPFDEVWLPLTDDRNQDKLILTARWIGGVWRNMLVAASTQTPPISRPEQNPLQARPHINATEIASNLPAPQSLGGTDWKETSHTLSGPADYKYSFQADGKLQYSNLATGTGYATWQQVGAFVYFEVNNGYAQFEAVINADRMEGEARNRYGQKWSWVAVRVPLSQK